MAGGMRTGRGETLAERSGRALPPSGPAAVPPALVRHCWVLDPPEATGKWPGLLLEWRREADGRWSGRTAYAVVTRERAVLVETWLDARMLHEA